MKKQPLSSVFAALALTAAATASAQVRISVGVDPFVFGRYAPPAVYQPAPYYPPPPVVYGGGGSWGGHHGGRARDGGRESGHSDQGRRH